MHRRAVLVAMVLLGTNAASADEAYDTCVSGGDKLGCAEGWASRENARVSDLTRQIGDLTDGSMHAALEKEQSAWEAFAKDACSFYLDEALGPGGQKAEYAECRAETLKARAESLSNYLKFIDN